MTNSELSIFFSRGKYIHTYTGSCVILTNLSVDALTRLGSEDRGKQMIGLGQLEPKSGAPQQANAREVIAQELGRAPLIMEEVTLSCTQLLLMDHVHICS